MKVLLVAFAALIAVACLPTSIRAAESALANPAIDMPGHLRIAAEAARHREQRIVTEAEFIRTPRPSRR